MRKLIIVIIALSMMGVFSSPSWAQPEGDDDEGGQPMGTETTTRIEAERVQDFQKVEGVYDQIEKTQELQQVDGLQNQVVANDAAALQISGCRVESINVGKDGMGVETKCLTEGGVQTLLEMKGIEGIVGVYDDGSGSGPVAFKSIEIGKQAAVEEQYNFAIKLVALALQDVAIARGTKLFGQEKCNQFTTEQGVKYEFFTRVGLSEKNTPIILGYKIKRIDTDKDAVNKDAVTIDVSIDLARDVFSGILPDIHAGGCPLTEWIEFPQVKTAPY